MDDGICMNILQGHTVSISLVISPDGKSLFSGSDDATIRVWKVDYEICMNILKGHQSMIFSLAISPDGQSLFSSSKDNTIKVWR